MRANEKEKSKKVNIRLIVTFIILVILFFIEASIVYIEKMNSNSYEADRISEQNSDVNMGTAKWDNLYEEKAIWMEKNRQAKIDKIRQTEKNEKESIAQNNNTNQQGNNNPSTNENDKEGSNQNDEPNKNVKVAYLTFDDGPSKYVTPEILDILNRYNIKATFFVVGNQAEKNPEVLKRIYEEGHAIGNHTYSHNYKFIYNNIENFLYELDITAQVMKRILGEDFETNIVRFPGGSFGEKKEPFRNIVLEKGYNYIDWNCLNGYAEGHHIPPNNLVKRVESTFKNQQELIILMHDTDAKGTTAEALPNIIEFLIEKGYEFASF